MSSEHMTHVIENETEAILNTAADILEERGWTQGNLSEDADGNFLEHGPFDERAATFCMLSSVTRAAADRHGTTEVTGDVHIVTREGKLVGRKWYENRRTFNREALMFYDHAVTVLAKRLDPRRLYYSPGEARGMIQRWNDQPWRKVQDVVAKLRGKEVTS